MRGFFLVEESELERLEDHERQAICDYMLNDGTIGVCRRSETGALEFIGLFPNEVRLQKQTFDNFHEKAWQDKEDKAHFRDTMLAEYPELSEYLTEGKETNKGEWSAAYEKFILARPEGIEFVELPATPPKILQTTIQRLLPQPIFVPAVKEVSDVTKTTSRSEFGALLSQLASEVEAELDEAIDQAMAEVYKRLNVRVDSDTGEAWDERHSGVQAIESRVSNYVSETFRDISVLLEFPNPQSSVMFSNARILVREAGFIKQPVDCVGEGVKRVLIFSLVRTLADLRQGHFSVCESREDEKDDGVNREVPLIILYEEAELFLHPGLQRALLRAFGELTEAGDQVIFTTHSPFMIDDSLSSINLVSKDSENGTRVASFQEALATRGSRERVRLLQVQNVSSYIFSDRVLLVEGLSDLIVVKKLARALDPSWDFEREGIPVLSVTGKSDLALYKAFLADLRIDGFVLADIDAVEDIVLDLCHTDARVRIQKVRDELLACVRRLAQTEDFVPRINKKYVDKLCDGYRWSRVFEDLEDLYQSLTTGEGEPTEKHLGSLAKLLRKRKEDAETKALRSDAEDVHTLRTQLAALLLSEHVLLLKGTIENYYPDGSTSNKIRSALNFDPTEFSRVELRSCFTPLSEESTDMELFLRSLFE